MFNQNQRKLGHCVFGAVFSDQERQQLPSKRRHVKADTCKNCRHELKACHQRFIRVTSHRASVTVVSYTHFFTYSFTLYLVPLRGNIGHIHFFTYSFMLYPIPLRGNIGHIHFFIYSFMLYLVPLRGNIGHIHFFTYSFTLYPVTLRGHIGHSHYSFVQYAYPGGTFIY